MKRLRRFLRHLAALFGVGLLVGLVIGHFRGRRCNGTCPDCLRRRRYQ